MIRFFLWRYWDKSQIAGIFKDITGEFSPFSRSLLYTAVLSTLETGFVKVTRFFYQYWPRVCRFPESLYLAKRYDINTPSGTHSCWSNWGLSCRTESSAIISAAITIAGKRLRTMRSNDTCLCRILSTILSIVRTDAICARSLITRVLHYYSPGLFQIPCGIRVNW